MVKYREIIRLAAMGVSQRGIAYSCGCGQSTVSDVLRAARAHGVEWPLPEEMDDAAIRLAIYPEASLNTLLPRDSRSHPLSSPCAVPINTASFTILRRTALSAACPKPAASSIRE